MAWRQTVGDLKHRLRLAPSFLWRWELCLIGVRLASPPILCGRPFVSRYEGSEISLGRDVRMDSSKRANPLGGEKPCVLRTLTPSAKIMIGDRVGMSSTTIVAGNSIEIGPDSILGAGCMILDNDFHVADKNLRWQTEYKINSRPVKIGQGCFLGTRSIILKGVVLGDGVVVGAGSVVTKDMPPRTLVAGNPARVARQLT